MSGLGDEVTAVAHPNIALSKYWGKLERPGNYPAVPSLSVTLEGMRTRTTVRFEDAPGEDDVRLAGGPLVAGREKVDGLLAAVRAAAGLGPRARAVVTSENDFPTGSGLASSASGFAALALAATRAAGLDWDAPRVSSLARAASASAARSLFGGYVELRVGEDAARPYAPASAMPLSVLVCVATDEAKAVSSTRGMVHTARASMYYATWLREAPRVHATLAEAVARGDFSAVGALAEESALAMHACALAAGVVYVRGVTLRVLAEIERLRAAGVEAYATIDAGPHVKALVRPADAPRARDALCRVRGVLRVLSASPGEGARVVRGDA